MKMKKSNVLLIFAAAAMLISCSGKKSSNTANIQGAGATFPLPYYTMAFKTYQDSTKTEVTYGGIGSGGGIRSLKDKVVDFAASDAFLSDEEMKSMPAVIHIPTCMGAVVLAYNLKGVSDLKLTGEIIADIYLGKITNWNDQRISSINPGVKLPNLKIVPAYRSDGSGTTFVFSDYLTKVSKDWASKVGAGKSLKWPTGIAAKGNPGVAGIISQTSGSIGYVGSEYAFAQNIAYAQLQNPAGKFIKPTLASISAAADAELPADTRTMITNSSNSKAYPISCFTWLILYKDQNYSNRSESQAKATMQLIDWMLSPAAQSLTTKVNYAPLPASVIENAKKQLSSINFGGKVLLK